MLGISDAAEAIGFRTNGVKITFEQLVAEKPLPCILHWNQNHFVVCYGIKKKRNGDYAIKISDPAGEKYTMDREAFLKCWISSVSGGEDTGTALLLTPTPDFYTQDNGLESSRSISYFFRYLRPYRSQIIQLILGLLVGSALSLILPFLTQAVVDQGIGNNNLSFITLVLIAQLILFVTQLAVEFIRNWITLHVNSRISISLISDFLSKLMKLPLRFFDTKNVGDIMQRIGDNDRIKSFLTGSTLTTLFSFVNFFIFAFILAYYS
jgi:ATP-binding cassette subfamily B protein